MSGTGVRMVVVTTHPVQYHAPWFRELVAEGVDLHVCFSLLPDAQSQATGFGGAFQWDVPVLEGYPWSLLPLAGHRADLGRFLGLRSRRVCRTLADLVPEVLLLTGWNAYPLLQALGASIPLGVPTIVRGESNALRPRPWWMRAGHRALLSFYDAFIAIGRSNRAFLEGNGVPSDRIVDGGYFVDEELFSWLRERDLPRRAMLRERWGIPAGACCFLFVGKLQPKKRPLDFVLALEAAATRLSEGALHGLVVGSGELEAEVRAKADSSRARITFAGFLNQSEIGMAYAAADVLVLPSDWGETWGLVVNEAMHFGMPAIVSDRVGCGPDLVRDGETGFVVPCGETDKLTERMVELALDSHRRREMGRRASELISGYTPRRGARAALHAARIAMGAA